MLNVVKFIEGNADWEDKLKEEPHFLSIKRKDNLVMFDYTQGRSQPCEIVNECRGLILDSENDFNVVRYGFYRFYNYGEPGATTIDNTSMSITEKVDGSLVMIYYYNNTWHISTRSTFDAIDASIRDTGKTFDGVIREALYAQNIDINTFDKECTYVFEVVSPETRVIVKYDKPEIYFLMCRNNTTYEEVNCNINCQKPKTYEFKTLEDIISYVSEFNGIDFEGVVVKDKYNHRVKIKNLNWLKLHYLYGNGNMTESRLLEVWWMGEYEEYISYFPEYKDMFENEFSKFWKLLYLSFLLDKLDLKSKMPKIRLVEIVNKTVHNGALQQMIYKAYDGNAFKWFITMDTDRYLHYFEEMWMNND